MGFKAHSDDETTTPIAIFVGFKTRSHGETTTAIAINSSNMIGLYEGVHMV